MDPPIEMQGASKKNEDKEKKKKNKTVYTKKDSSSSWIALFSAIFSTALWTTGQPTDPGTAQRTDGPTNGRTHPHIES